MPIPYVHICKELCNRILTQTIQLDMLIVQDKLVDDEILKEEFMCNLNACKGACCWEGDMGAPLEEKEIEILDKEYASIRPFLTSEGQDKLDAVGTNVYYEEDKMMGTPLIENAACAFMTKNELGMAQCGIEQAWRDGKSSLRKPVSCHLYPIRIEQDHFASFETLRYDRWDICSAACSKGKDNKIKVFEFAKDALIRKYGQDWYDELEAAYVNRYKDQSS